MADYTALRAADAGLPGAPPPAEAAALLNAASVSRPRAFAWREARSLAQRLGRWGYVLSRARLTPVVPIATIDDAAILAAIHAASMDADQVIDPADAAAWAEMEQGLDVLLAVGDLTAPCAAAIRALGAETISPAAAIGWPPVTADDITHARSL